MYKKVVEFSFTPAKNILVFSFWFQFYPTNRTKLTTFSDMKWYSIDMDDMKDIWYPSIYIGNGLTFKSQGSFGPEPKSLNILW